RSLFSHLVAKPSGPRTETLRSAAITHSLPCRKSSGAVYGRVLRASSAITAASALAGRDGRQQVSGQRQGFVVQPGGNQVTGQGRPCQPARRVSGRQPDAGRVCKGPDGGQPARQHRTPPRPPWQLAGGQLRPV